MNRELIEKLRKVNFSWCLSKNDVWNASFPDVEGINSRLYDSIENSLQRLKEAPTERMLGKIFLGEQGAGKTHFIASLRRKISPDVTFIYADMTGIKDFWRTLLHEVLSSLGNKMGGVEQTLRILSSFLGERERDKCVRASSSELLDYEKKIQAILFQADSDKAMKYRDALRAFLLFCSEDVELKLIGADWLKGYGAVEAESRNVRFGVEKSDAREVVLALAWFASFKGPTLFAIDQIDALASDKEDAQTEKKDSWLQEAVQKKRLIVQSLTNGMASLVTDAPRSLVLLTCIDFSLASLRENSLGSALDRFEERTPLLEKLSSVQLMQQLVEARIGEVAPRAKSFPFSPKFFEKLESHTPRRILQMCERALQAALERFDRDGSFEEITHFTEYVENSAEQNKIEAQFIAAVSDETEAAKTILDAKDVGEERIGNLLCLACKWFVDENDLHEKFAVELMGGRKGDKSPALHARVAVSRGDNAEMTVCFRCLLPSHYATFRSRLESAIVASGIDCAVASRRLVIFSNQEMPKWDSAKETVKKFRESKGVNAILSQKKLTTLLALEKISSMNGFHSWLRNTKPINRSAIFTGMFEEEQKPPVRQKQSAPALSGLLIGSSAGRKICLPTRALCEHSVILASSGSGKTVLLRRMIEQAALHGIPSIVIDAGNDLARLGIPRLETEDDEYFKRAEVVVWTPGARVGRPIVFPPLPDFSEMKDDENARSQAVNIAEETLSKFVAPGKSTKSNLKRGLLHSALQRFALEGYKPRFKLNWFAKESRLSDFIKFLEALPEDAQIGITGAKKMAKEMADVLKSERQRNPDFQDSPPFDIASLLTAKESGKVRVSVVSLSALQNVESQCSFINQLAMNLFLHVRKNPATNGEAQAIFAIDEAQDFIPAGSATTVCKTNLLRLVAQGRKYGLGLIFATQNPRNLDYKAMGNIGTYFLGRTQAPNTVKQLSELIESWGSSGKKGKRYAVGCLERGEFFLRSTNGYMEPLKVVVPMCLSLHPTGEALSHEEIMKLARKLI